MGAAAAAEQPSEVDDVLQVLELAALHRLRREDEEASDARPVHEARPGIKVDYFEDINSNAEYFGKIQGPLSQGRGIDRDIIVLTDNERFLGLMIDKGWVEQLDKDKIPNIANLIDAQASPPFDPGPQVHAALAVRHDGDRLEREASPGPVTSVDAAASRTRSSRARSRP